MQNLMNQLQQNLNSATPRQEIYYIEDEDDKRRKLNEFLASMEEGEKVMVFVNKKSRCDDIASDLCIKGTSCQSIHGDREQSDREQAIDDLKTGEVSILIATDVASRGIDIQVL